MGKPDCVNGKCLIQGRFFIMGSLEGVGDSDEHPQRVVGVSKFRVGQMEVSIGEYKEYLAKTRSVQLQAVLSGCAKGDATRTIPGNAGETMDQLRIRATQVYVTEQCKKIRTGQLIPKGLPMEDGCDSMNGKEDCYPVVCLTMKEMEDYCAAQGGRLMTAAEYHYAADNEELDVRPERFDDGDSSAPECSGFVNNGNDGVRNLIGNVREALADAYEPDFYARMPGTDPYNPLTNPQEQLEELGGACTINVDTDKVRRSDRSSSSPNERYRDVGFRCVWPPTEDGTQY